MKITFLSASKIRKTNHRNKNLIFSLAKCVFVRCWHMPSRENHSCSVERRTWVVIQQVDANDIIGPHTHNTRARPRQTPAWGCSERSTQRIVVYRPHPYPFTLPTYPCATCCSCWGWCWRCGCCGCCCVGWASSTCCSGSADTSRPSPRTTAPSWPLGCVPLKMDPWLITRYDKAAANF